MAAERENWHLDRRVPLALILALTVQTGGIVWWAATLQANGEALQTRVEKLAAQASSGLQIGERIARLEERLEGVRSDTGRRSEEHTSELQSLMRISYAVFCLKKK